MSNMSYCRFENTYRDLQDCYDALSQEGVEEYEKEAGSREKPYVRRLLELCKDISEEFWYDLEE